MRKLRVLVGCEYSGKVRDAFLARGHYAVSCDLLPSDSPDGEHYQGNVLDIINDGWDLGIFFPSCQYLAVSGNRWMKNNPEREEKRLEALLFVEALMRSKIKRKSIENPVSVISSYIRKPDQTIQPWQFGHGEVKRTCLWLDNLPLLQPTNIVPGRAAIVHKMPPSADRWKKRSTTYDGVAQAMACQWSNL